MLELDYTNQRRRPSVSQIIADWKRNERPGEFSVSYGETYAHFQRADQWGTRQWFADGNGCAGVKRDQVERALNTLDGKE